MFYFYGGSVFISVSIYVAASCSWKAWKAVRLERCSDRTRELQQQFTRSLIAQVTRF